MLYETFSNSLLAEGSEAHSLSEGGKHAINRTAINCVAILYSTAVFFCLEAEEDSHHMDTSTATGGSESDSDSEQVLENDSEEAEGCFKYTASFNNYISYLATALHTCMHTGLITSIVTEQQNSNYGDDYSPFPSLSTALMFLMVNSPRPIVSL